MKPGTQKLSEVARHVVEPEGIVATSWPRVRDTCSNLGWSFDRWQDGAGRLILAVRGDGLYAADTVVMSIPRQVGKTYLVGCIVFALALLFPGLTVIWTAHRFKTARETFSSMKAMAASPLVAPHIRHVSNANGEEAILFNNGSRIMFGARENGFGLGFANVGVLVLDEGQRLTSKSMDDLIPTMNTAANPLVVVMGTPPRPTDPGEVFTMLRQDALDGESEGTLYIEFSADEDADLDDRDQLRKANPSYSHRTSERAIRRMRKNLTDDSFRREAYGIHDKFTVNKPVVSAGRWRTMFDVGPADGVKPDGFGVDMWYDREISVGACWVEDDLAHIEEVWADSDPVKAVGWITDNAGRRTEVLIAADSPATSLAPELNRRGVRVRIVSRPEYAQACGAVENRAKPDMPTLTHGGQKRLTDAMSAARPHMLPGGGWIWDKADPTAKIQPIVATTLALLAATRRRRRRTGNRSMSKGRVGVAL